MFISIITPFYCGNKFMNNYFLSINQASKSFIDEGNRLEIILVNDSPWELIHVPEIINYNYTIKIINNKKNYGIHQSRIYGLIKAEGEYIIFLDQDDELTVDSLVSQKNKIKNYDIVLANGIFELPEKKQLIYGDLKSIQFATKKWPYFLVRDLIISPGQCLIKKSSIPHQWISYILQTNGTDDYLLWILMLDEGKKITYNEKLVYIHKYTGENISVGFEHMYKSSYEMLSLLKSGRLIRRLSYFYLQRTIKYKYEIGLGKKRFLISSLKNLDIFMINVIFRFLFKGCHL